MTHERNPDTQRHARLVIVGAGFAGASLIRNLPPALRRPGETLLIDREESYTFVPLIHEVAVGRIHPDSVRSGIPPLCKSRCKYLRAEVTEVDLPNRTVKTSVGDVSYEYLVLAPGSGAARPPEEIGHHLSLFRGLEDALHLRAALDHAWRDAHDPRRRSALESGPLTVGVVGGGATGVELSAEIAALFDYLRKRSLRKPATPPRVILVEATDRLMGWLDPYFHRVALQQLARLGVEVRLNASVEEATDKGVRAGDEWIPARIRVWAAGIEASSVVQGLAGDHDPTGRVRVDSHLSLPGHPEVYILGDSSVYDDPRYGSLPPTASLAVQQGPWVARDLVRRLRARRRPAFDVFNRGYVVSLGPGSAVAETLGAKFAGRAAQALYRSVLLYYLKSRRDRVLTGVDWTMERTIGRLGFETASRGRTTSGRRSGTGAM